MRDIHYMDEYKAMKHRYNSLLSDSRRNHYQNNFSIKYYVNNKKFEKKYSFGQDESFTNLIKLTKICTPLSYIINNSFKYGIFPWKLKLAIVKPLLKKEDPSKVQNYHPISLLC